jgi:hypothetical protein
MGKKSMKKLRQCKIEIDNEIFDRRYTRKITISGWIYKFRSNHSETCAIIKRLKIDSFTLFEHNVVPAWWVIYKSFENASQDHLTSNRIDRTSWIQEVPTPHDANVIVPNPYSDEYLDTLDANAVLKDAKADVRRMHYMACLLAYQLIQKEINACVASASSIDNGKNPHISGYVKDLRSLDAFVKNYEKHRDLTLGRALAASFT